MVRAQVELREDQVKTLKRLAEARGVSVEELIRQGVEYIIRSSAYVDEDEMWRRAMNAAGRFCSGKSDMIGEYGVPLIEVSTEKDSITVNKCLDIEDYEDIIHQIIVTDFKREQRSLSSVPYIKMLSDYREWEYAWLIRNSRLKRGMFVLDVGSEYSFFPFYLAKRGCNVVSIDMCYSHYRKLLSYETKGVHVIQGDIRNPPFKISLFDRIFCISVLEHIPGDGDIIAVKAMSALLKPGGILCITVDIAEKYWPYGTSPHGQKFGRPRKHRTYDAASIVKRIIEPSGLAIYGNMSYSVNDWENSHTIPPRSPDGNKIVNQVDYRYTMASVFLVKTHGG